MTPGDVPFRCRAVAALLLLLLVSFAARSADRTWTGAGSDGNWSTAANWGGAAPVPGDVLVFPSGAANKVTINDFGVGTPFDAIQIGDNAYTFGGSAIRIASGINTSYAAGTVVFPLDAALDGNAAVAIGAGATLVCTGVLADGVGTGALAKSGGGTLDLGGATADNTFRTLFALEGLTLLN